MTEVFMFIWLIGGLFTLGYFISLNAGVPVDDFGEAFIFIVFGISSFLLAFCSWLYA